MRHWRVEINFEAWDEQDANRMVDRMLKPVDAERRLLFATDPLETHEMHTGTVAKKPGELAE